MLLAVELVGHRRRAPHTVGAEVPKRLAGCGIGRNEAILIVAEKQQVAGSGQRSTACSARTILWQLPRDLAGLHVDGAQDLLIRRFLRLPRRATPVRLSGHPLAHALDEDVAVLERLHVI